MAAAPPPSRVGRFLVQTSRRTGLRYYTDPSTNVSVWHDDRLPAGWAWGKDGETAPKYFINLHTGTRQAEVPSAHAAPPTGAGAEHDGGAERVPKRSRDSEADVDGAGGAASSASGGTGAGGGDGAAGPAAKRGVGAASAPAVVSLAGGLTVAITGKGGAAGGGVKISRPDMTESGVLTAGRAPTIDMATVGAHWLPGGASREPGAVPALAPNLLAALQELCAQPNCGMPPAKPAWPVYRHGWFFRPHKTVLRNLLGPETKVILELGSWLGSSLSYMAQLAPNAILIAVDLWSNKFVAEEQGDHYCADDHQIRILERVPLYETFLANMWEQRHRLLPVRMDTQAGMAVLGPILVKHGVCPDLIYVDADHHYAPAKADISACVSHFPGAAIVGDDYDYPDVRRAAGEVGAALGRRVYAEDGKCWTYSTILPYKKGRYGDDGVWIPAPGAVHTAIADDAVRPPPGAAAGGGGGGEGSDSRFTDVSVPAAQQSAFAAWAQDMADILQDDHTSGDAGLIAAGIKRGRQAAARFDPPAAAGGAGGPAGSGSAFAGWLAATLPLKKGAGKGLTVLQMAARLNRAEAIRALVTGCGADVNVQSGRKGMTPLILAAFSGHVDAVRLLLQLGADTTPHNVHNETALAAAAFAFKDDVVGVLQAWDEKARDGK